MEKKTVDLTDSDFELNFLAEDEPTVEVELKKPYRVLIADDDKEVHAATNLLLRNFKFEDHPLELLHTYSGAETKVVLSENEDIALVFLDVVMEENDTGLKVVNYIRQELNNQKIRIILRTGQPGEAPEEEVIAAYDINDYRLKTELSATRLYTSVYEALRSYRDLMTIEMHRRGLEQIVNISSELFTSNSIEAFYNCILNQILNYKNEELSAICFREREENGGFVFLEQTIYCNIVAATGKYAHLMGEKIQDVSEVRPIIEAAHQLINSDHNEILQVAQGYLIYRVSPFDFKTFIYVEGAALNRNVELLKSFLTHYDLALNHYLINQRLGKLNCEIIDHFGYDEALDYLNHKASGEIDSAVLEAFIAQFQAIKA